MSSNDDLARDLRPAITRLYLALRRRAPIAGLSAAQSSALSTLLFHGPLRMGALAEREGIRMPTATALVDGLAKLGLVTRRPDADDRRAVVVELTAQGRTTVEQVRRRRDDALAQALAQLSDDHRDALAASADALAELQRRLDDIPIIPEAASTDE
ncbi:putative MarR family transcriptional regulator [Gordonia araii NBRC 100433]|uniref:Putative MarR family transcriptional regulator n=1 Tax=Gordonia araii NBRC 100433 TaxID=1073574 RepID=G7H6D7_9ACTN|nr:MarR family transcriptional regulator [Gordonia araii]NNG96092.1 MarR family transcriptional regulator [Gordonia araii NBRC 100433]GAB11412.1 putative MarR family transcriptional regulator [Gordonia araii NBRC 100433]